MIRARQRVEAMGGVDGRMGGWMGGFEEGFRFRMRVSVFFMLVLSYTHVHAKTITHTGGPMECSLAMEDNSSGNGL